MPDENPPVPQRREVHAWFQGDWDDLGNAKRFALIHGEILRYYRGQWYSFKANRWSVLTEAEVMAIANQTVEKLRKKSGEPAHAAALVAADKQKYVKAGLTELGKIQRLRAMVFLARSWESILTSLAPDSNPWVLNVQNGLLDLKDLVLRPHSHEHFNLKMSPVVYDPKAKCPLFRAFVKEIFGGDEELQLYVQRAIGYSLLGKVLDQVVFVAHGPSGANGKSTLFQVLGRIFGDYLKTAAPDLLTKKSEAHFEQADLSGARLLLYMEGEDEMEVYESRLKHLSGGDRIKARHPYQDFFEFEPSHKLWLVTNHLPRIKGSQAVWRRMRCIPFNVTIPKERQDVRFPDKLLAEAPGVLNWAIEGCTGYLASGLPACTVLDRSTKEYQDQEDKLGNFISDRCVVSPVESVMCWEIYDAFVSWCHQCGEGVWSRKTFSMRMKARGFVEGRKRARYWKGINKKTDTMLKEERDSLNGPETE